MRLTLRILFLSLWLAPLLARAQPVRDLQAWKGLVLQKTFFDNRLQLSLNEEVRLKDNFSDIDKSFTDVSLHYKPLKRLAIGGGYRYSVRPDINTHRIYADLTWRPRLESRFGITLRTRLQRQSNPVEVDSYLRARLNIAYDIKGLKWEPYIGAEPFLQLQGALSDLEALRIYAGLRYPIRKKVELRLGYIFDQELDDPEPAQNHVIAARITVDLDKDDEKDKADTQIGW